MFNIETMEDVAILRELTGDNKRIKALEDEVLRLSQENENLTVLAREQKKTIDKMNKSLITPDQCRDIVFELINGQSKVDVLKAKSKRKIGVPKPEKEEFDFASAMKRKFNKILVDGNTLIHHTIKNQKMKLPISTVELLALVEVYQYRKRKLLNEDSTRFCKLYGISKVQFGKIYYNLKEGVFFKTIDEINNQIRGTVFRYENGTIHIVDGSTHIDTKIDSKTFNYLLNVYMNSSQPYATIYKLSKEKHQLNPVHILAVLKKNTAVSKAISEAR